MQENVDCLKLMRTAPKMQIVTLESVLFLKISRLEYVLINNVQKIALMEDVNMAFVTIMEAVVSIMNIVTNTVNVRMVFA